MMMTVHNDHHDTFVHNISSQLSVSLIRSFTMYLFMHIVHSFEY